MMVTAASGTPIIPAGTIVLNKDATTAAPNVILELNNPVNIGAADTLDFTTPAQIVVSEAVDVSVGDGDTSSDFGFSITDSDGNSVASGGADFEGLACLDLENGGYDVGLSSAGGGGYVNAYLKVGHLTYGWD